MLLMTSHSIGGTCLVSLVLNPAILVMSWCSCQYSFSLVLAVNMVVPPSLDAAGDRVSRSVPMVACEGEVGLFRCVFSYDGWFDVLAWPFGLWVDHVPCCGRDWVVCVGLLW